VNTRILTSACGTFLMRYAYRSHCKTLTNMFYVFLLGLLVLCIFDLSSIGPSDLEGPIGSRVASSLRAPNRTRLLASALVYASRRSRQLRHAAIFRILAQGRRTTRVSRLDLAYYTTGTSSLFVRCSSGLVDMTFAAAGPPPSLPLGSQSRGSIIVGLTPSHQTHDKSPFMTLVRVQGAKAAVRTLR
jgi:hypothetical protein